MQSRAEIEAEVAAIYVACRLGELSMLFDNPLTGKREEWRRGRMVRHHPLDGQRAEFQPIFGTWNPPLYTTPMYP